MQLSATPQWLYCNTTLAEYIIYSYKKSSPKILANVDNFTAGIYRYLKLHNSAVILILVQTYQRFNRFVQLTNQLGMYSTAQMLIYIGQLQCCLATSFVDPAPNWFSIQQLCQSESGSVFRILSRIRDHKLGKVSESSIATLQENTVLTTISSAKSAHYRNNLAAMSSEKAQSLKYSNKVQLSNKAIQELLVTIASLS